MVSFFSQTVGITSVIKLAMQQTVYNKVFISALKCKMPSFSRRNSSNYVYYVRNYVLLYISYIDILNYSINSVWSSEMPCRGI